MYVIGDHSKSVDFDNKLGIAIKLGSLLYPIHSQLIEYTSIYMSIMRPSFTKILIP